MNLLAMSFTFPGWREGRSTGCDLTLLKVLFPAPDAGPEALLSFPRVGDLEYALSAELVVYRPAAPALPCVKALLAACVAGLSVEFKGSGEGEGEKLVW